MTPLVDDDWNQIDVFGCECGCDTAHVFVVDHAINGSFGHWCEAEHIVVEEGGGWRVDDYGDVVDDPDNYANSPSGDTEPACDPPDWHGGEFEDVELRCAGCHKEIEF
jgi:hypothetical protein